MRLAKAAGTGPRTASDGASARVSASIVPLPVRIAADQRIHKSVHHKNCPVDVRFSSPSERGPPALLFPMDVAKPCICLGRGAMDVADPCRFVGFGAMDVAKL